MTDKRFPALVLLLGLTSASVGCSAESAGLQGIVQCDKFQESFEFRRKDDLDIQYYFGRGGSLGFAEFGALPVGEENHSDIIKSSVHEIDRFTLEKYEYKPTALDRTDFFRIQFEGLALKIYDVNEDWVRELLEECGS